MKKNIRNKYNRKKYDKEWKGDIEGGILLKKVIKKGPRRADRQTHRQINRDTVRYITLNGILH